MTPNLTNRAGMLTLEGEALADWLIDTHQTTDRRAAARMFAAQPGEAPRLWAVYEQAGATVEKAPLQTVIP